MRPSCLGRWRTSMAVLEQTESTLVRPLTWERTEDGRRSLVSKEWLVTNGLGGYASGTISGALTRRYHALLVAALPTPYGRTVVLNHLWERLRFPDGRLVSLPEITETPAGREFDCSQHLVECRIEAGLPVWVYEVEGVRFEKRVLMPFQQNTTHVTYRLLSNAAVRIEICPLVAFRLHDAPVSHQLAAPYMLRAIGDRFEIDPEANFPPLRLFVHGRDKAFTVVPETIEGVSYELEESRGYDSRGDLWLPGYFRLTLAPDAPGTLVASTESWETIHALNPDELVDAERHRRQRLIESAKHVQRTDFGSELVLAADQFII